MPLSLESNSSLARRVENAGRKHCRPSEPALTLERCKMEPERLQEIQKNIPGHFGTPKSILADEDLDAAQKLKLLRQWEFDLRQLLVATEENMPGTEAKPGNSAELLQEVRRALASIEGEAPTKDTGGGPSKAGGQTSKPPQ